MFEATLRQPCWSTVVKFIDLFHLWPWPGTIERLNIIEVYILFHFLPNLVQNISLFPVCTMVLAVILGSHLELYGQDSPKTQYIPFYQICDLKISRKRRLVCLYDPPDSRYITVHVFQYDVGGHVRGAIMDLNVKMVPEHSINHSITCVMPELTGNDTSFVQSSNFFWFSIWHRQPFWTAIWNLKINIDPKY